MRTCVFGLGNIGAITAYFLRKHSPMVISRRARECTERNIALAFPDGREEEVSPLVCGLNEEANCDVALFASKAYEVKDYVVGFKGNIKEAYCLQNGYGVWDEVAPRTLSKKAFPAPVTYGVWRDNERFIVAGEGAYYMGGFRNERPMFQREVAEYLRSGGARVVEVEDVEPYVWLKLLVNSVTNPLTAVLNIRNGAILTNGYLWKIALEVIGELLEVAKREGVEFKVDPVSYVKEVLHKTASNYSSMLQDIMRNRKTEIDYINGFIVRRALEYGVKAPVNTTLYYLVKSMELTRGLSDE